MSRAGVIWIMLDSNHIKFKLICKMKWAVVFFVYHKVSWLWWPG